MASSKAFLDFIMDQLSSLRHVSFRAMMGEYVIYYKGKVIGGIYDDRFLIKPTPSVRALMPDAPEEIPYEGAKAMLLCENTDDREFLKTLMESVCRELPEPKPKMKKMA